MTTCTINETQNYIETVSFRSVAALPDHFKISIQTQLLDAKDPAALHVKCRSIFSGSTLRELRDSINELFDS